MDASVGYVVEMNTVNSKCISGPELYWRQGGHESCVAFSRIAAASARPWAHNPIQGYSSPSVHTSAMPRRLLNTSATTLRCHEVYRELPNSRSVYNDSAPSNAHAFNSLASVRPSSQSLRMLIQWPIILSALQQDALLLGSRQGTFSVDTIPVPQPGANEVLIRVEAAALNPIDWKIQKYGIVVETYPAVLGSDIAGVIEDVGSNVTAFAMGDRV